jgi:hypothetical protein
LATAPVLHDVELRRSLDADAINRICNHPEVLPSLSLHLETIDVSGLLADKRNVAFLGEFGGALFHWCAPGVYAAHDFFLPQGRGKWALKASRFMLAEMFGNFRARMIWAQTPIDLHACRLFNRWLGFKSEGISKQSLAPGWDPIAVETFVMERG